MNTLIVTLLIYRHKLLKNWQSSSNTEGFTLLELLVTVVILGTLAAFAFPAYTAVVDNSRYGNARTQMSCIAKELKTFKLENSYYPVNIGANQAPVVSTITREPAINCFYTTASGQVPFNSRYDYQARNMSVGGQNVCGVFVIFYGKDNIKQISFNDNVLLNHFSSGTTFYSSSSNDDLTIFVELSSGSCG